MKNARTIPPSVGDVLIFRRGRDGRVPLLCKGKSSVSEVTHFVIFHTDLWLRSSASFPIPGSHEILSDVSLVIKTPSLNDVYSHSYVVMWDGIIAYVDEDAVRDRFHVIHSPPPDVLRPARSA